MASRTDIDGGTGNSNLKSQAYHHGHHRNKKLGGFNRERKKKAWSVFASNNKQSKAALLHQIESIAALACSSALQKT
mgnify:CR=1 FL=1